MQYRFTFRHRQTRSWPGEKTAHQPVVPCHAETDRTGRRHNQRPPEYCYAVHYGHLPVIHPAAGAPAIHRKYTSPSDSADAPTAAVKDQHIKKAITILFIFATENARIIVIIQKANANLIAFLA